MKKFILIFQLILCLSAINSNAASNSIEKEFLENQEYLSNQLTEVLSVSIVATDVKCFGGNDGLATASVSGGISPYSFLWNDQNSQTTITSIGLKAGNYSFRVTDAIGNSATASITIKEPNALDVSVEIQCVTTYGGSDGAVIFSNPVGGSGAYQYSINGIDWLQNNKLDNLKAGIYPVQIRDANTHSCITLKGNYEIREQVKISATVQTSDVTCFGANDGTIRISDLQNGQPPYQFSLDGINWMSSNVFAGLKAGIYDVNVIDAKNSITKLVRVNINQPDKLEVKCTNTNVTSLGANDGSITVIGQSGGSGIYEYSKDGIVWQSSATFNHLAPAIYTIWVRDANSLSCKISKSVTVLEAISITGSVTWVNVTCFGASDGFVTFSNPTGAINYEYSIGLNWQSTNIFTGLPAGTYSAMIRDANNTANMSVLANIAISEPAPLETIVTATAETFAGAKDGVITISSTTGGSGSYEFSINGTNWTSSSQFTGITSGTYTIHVRDRNAPTCQLVFSKTIQPAGTLIADVTHTNTSCNGGNNGSILISNASGADVIEYSIDGGFTWTKTSTFIGLSAGTYDVMIRDANNTANKISLGKVIITQSTQLHAVFTNYSPPLCTGTSGSFTISATGGTPPYTGVGDFILPSGASRTYLMSDKNGCTVALSVSMPDPPKITATAVINPPNYCNENGTIVIAATGGTGTLTGIGTFPVQAGKSYSFKVTDSNGCSSNIISGVMPNPDNTKIPMTITESITEIDFGLQRMGAINLQVAGGTESYTYQWSNGAVTKDIHDLKEGGTYSVTVTDSNGCAKSKSITLAFPNYLPIANAGIDQIVYEGVTVTLDGSGSTDANQDKLSYIWTVPSGILLSNSTSSKPSFLAPEVKRDSIIAITLVVNDGKVNSAPSTVKVAIQNVIKVGITTLGLSAMMIYPNPTKGILMIEGLSASKKNKIAIFTADGRLIRKETGNVESTIIDISDKPSGIYLIVINNQSFKILKN